MARQIIRYQGELWSEIPGHHGKYFASRNGQILSLAEVLEIRKARGTASLRELGAKYGVSHTAIRRAMLGIKWGYLEEGLR